MKTQPNPSDREVLAGLVERVTYHNVENGFCPCQEGVILADTIGRKRPRLFLSPVAKPKAPFFKGQQDTVLIFALPDHRVAPKFPSTLSQESLNLPESFTLPRRRKPRPSVRHPAVGTYRPSTWSSLRIPTIADTCSD